MDECYYINIYFLWYGESDVLKIKDFLVFFIVKKWNVLWLMYIDYEWIGKVCKYYLF